MAAARKEEAAEAETISFLREWCKLSPGGEGIQLVFSIVVLRGSLNSIVLHVPVALWAMVMRVTWSLVAPFAVVAVHLCGGFFNRPQGVQVAFSSGSAFNSILVSRWDWLLLMTNSRHAKRVKHGCRHT